MEKASRQTEEARTEMMPVKPQLRVSQTWDRESEKTKHWAGTETWKWGKVREIQVWLPATAGSESWLLKRFQSAVQAMNAYSTDNTRGLMRKRTPGFCFCKYGEENEIRPSYINTYCNRLITQELNTKRWDSELMFTAALSKNRAVK